MSDVFLADPESEFSRRDNSRSTMTCDTGYGVLKRIVKQLQRFS